MLAGVHQFSPVKPPAVLDDFFAIAFRLIFLETEATKPRSGVVRAKPRPAMFSQHSSFHKKSCRSTYPHEEKVPLLPTTAGISGRVDQFRFRRPSEPG